jgi:pilus assembly protein Flp/PilA
MARAAAKYLASLLSDEQGATMVEYALMLAFIAAVCVGAVTLLGTNTNSSYSSGALTGAL